MPRPRRPFVAHPRNPLTGKQMRVSGRSAHELASLLAEVDTLRTRLQYNRISVEEADRVLRQLQHGAITFERAARAYAEREDLAENTKQAIDSFIRGQGAPLASLHLHQLGAPTLAPWIQKMQARGEEPSSIRTYWRRVRAIVRHATERGWIGAAPWGTWEPKIRGAEEPSEREAARDVGELRMLLSSARQIDEERAQKGALRALEPKVACASVLGLRRGELAGLIWTDPRPEESAVLVARQYAGGRLKMRRRPKLITTGHELFEILARWRRELEAHGLYKKDGPIFPNLSTSTPGHPRPYETGKALSDASLRKAVARAGLPHPEKWSSHSLRNTFVTLEARYYGTHPDGPIAGLPAFTDRTRLARRDTAWRYMRAATRELPGPGFSLGAPDLPPPVPRLGAGGSER